MPVRLVLFASAVATLIFANQVWLDYRYGGLILSWWRALAISAADWFGWAGVAPAITWLGCRWPIATGRRLSGLAVHVPVSLLTAAVKTSVDRALVLGFLVDRTPPSSALKLFMALCTYWAILAGAAAWRQARERREREARASRLEAELARAQLDALRARLQPHFLFNTLNGISALMREDVEAADLMMTRLATLLRLTLQRSGVATVPLRDEIEFTRLYLDLQAARWGDRLSVEIDVAADALAVPVPSLLLQPLVENAFTHGLAVRPGPMRLVVRGRLSEEGLTLEVEDDGPGPPRDWTPGVGIGSTRARLESHADAADRLTLERGALGGALVRLSVPAAGRVG